MPPTTFTVFPSLPIELRHLIWTFTLPGPRRIAPSTIPAHKRTHFDSMPAAPDYCSPYNPITLNISRESREVALRRYRTWLNAASVGYQYVDFSIDTISFDASDFGMRFGSSPGATLLKLARMDMQRIERLDLGFWGLRDGIGQELKKWIKTWLRVFTGVTELRILILVWIGERTAYGYDATKIKTVMDVTRDVGERAMEEYSRTIVRGKGQWKSPFLSVLALEEHVTGWIDPIPGV